MEALAQSLALVVPTIVLGLLLAGLNERLVEKFVKPILKRMEQDWLTAYVAWVTGTAISLAVGIDLFSPLFEALGVTPRFAGIGWVLTALAFGGGSHLIHDWWPTQLPSIVELPQIEMEGVVEETVDHDAGRPLTAHGDRADPGQ